MTGKDIAREAVIVLGTGAVSGAIFWMGVYLAGPIAILPGAGALFLALASFQRRMSNARLVAERGALACLLAAQTTLLAAVCIEMLPVVARNIL